MWGKGNEETSKSFSYLKVSSAHVQSSIETYIHAFRFQFQSCHVSYIDIAKMATKWMEIVFEGLF